MDIQTASTGTPNTLAMDFLLSPGDLIRAQFWYFFSLWLIRILYAVNAYAAVTVGYGVAKRGLLPGDLKAFVWMSVWFVLLPAMLVWTGWSQYRRLRAKGHTCSWRFSEQGIDTASPLAKASFSWQALERVVETRHAFYLFVQRRLFHVIPTRAFQNPGEVQFLRGLLRDKLGKKAKIKVL